MPFKFNKSIRMILRKGTSDDPYIEKGEQIVIVNTRIGLNETPDEAYRVRITGYIEVPRKKYEEKKTLASNEFVVDYENGEITFNESENGKKQTVNYKGRGVIQYPAERIYVHSPNPWAVDNLQELVDLVYRKEQEIYDFVALKTKEMTTLVEQKKNEIFQFVLDKTKELKDYVDKTKKDVMDYINAFIDRAEKKINEMDNNIVLCEKATQDSQNQTKLAKSATDKSIEQTDKAKKATNESIKANEESIKATKDCVEATEVAIDESNQMYKDRLETRIIWKDPVPNYADIIAKYSNPLVGWTTTDLSEGKVYRFDGNAWRFIAKVSAGIPIASEELDGIMAKEMVAKLNKIEYEAQRNLTGEEAKAVLPDYFKHKTIVFLIADREIKKGVQDLLIQFPYKGIITNVTGVCRLAGNTETSINIEKQSKLSFNKNLDDWELILDPIGQLNFPYSKKVSDSTSIMTPYINEGDYFRLKTIKVGQGIKNITVQIEIEI